MLVYLWVFKEIDKQTTGITNELRFWSHKPLNWSLNSILNIFITSAWIHFLFSINFLFYIFFFQRCSDGINLQYFMYFSSEIQLKTLHFNCWINLQTINDNIFEVELLLKGNVEWNWETTDRNNINLMFSV